MIWQAPTEIWICPECGTLYTMDTKTREPVGGSANPDWGAMACCEDEYIQARLEQAGREAEDD
jgi:hypothetical protein